MKNTIKKLAVLGAVLFLAAAAYAQIGGSPVVLSSGAGNWYAAVTNNSYCSTTNAILDTSKATTVLLQFKAELSDAGTTANAWGLECSLDKSKWYTMTGIAWTPAGTTPVYVATNITIAGWPYVRVWGITNANANTGYITNYSVRAFIK